MEKLFLQSEQPLSTILHRCSYQDVNNNVLSKEKALLTTKS